MAQNINITKRHLQKIIHEEISRVFESQQTLPGYETITDFPEEEMAWGLAMDESETAQEVTDLRRKLSREDHEEFMRKLRMWVRFNPVTEWVDQMNAWTTYAIFLQKHGFPVKKLCEWETKGNAVVAAVMGKDSVNWQFCGGGQLEEDIA